MDNNSVKKLAIGLFILNIISLLMSSFIGQGLNIPQLTQVNTYVSNIQGNTNQIASALNVTVLTPLQTTPNSFVGVLVFIPNILIFVANLLAKVLYFVIGVIAFVITGLILVFYLLFVFIPGMLSTINLGEFNIIFLSAYGLLGLVVAVYSLNYLANLIRGMRDLS